MAGDRLAVVLSFPSRAAASHPTTSIPGPAAGPLNVMVNTSKKGATIERRGTAIIEAMGYKLVAKASRCPRVVNGRFFQGAVDLAGGSIDRIFAQRGERPLAVQFTTAKVGISEKRAAIEEFGAFDPDYWRVQVWLWHEPEKPGQRGHFEVRTGPIYHAADAFEMREGDVWPWLRWAKPEQMKL